MTTYQIGPFTIEGKPREWRAWVTPSREEGFLDGEEYRDKECMHVAGAGPGLWRSVNDGTHACRARLPCFDYRRPAPLPFIDPELVSACQLDGQYVWKIDWIYTNERERCVMHLRTLLPGYEEQLAKERIITTLARPGVAEELARRLEEEEPVDMDEAKPSPVPVDGWRPIDKDMPRDGSEFLAWDGSRRFVCWWHPGVNHRGKDQWTGGFMDANDGDDCPPMDEKPTRWQPLPPPPQENSL